jgi:hypothetical protein
VIRTVMFAFTMFPEAFDALRRHAWADCEVVYTGPGDGDYWRPFARHWDNPDGDLLVVEQDVVLHEQVVPQLESCPEPWCEFPHPNREDIRSMMQMSLGCTRFSAALRARARSSDILERARLDDHPAHGWAAPGVLRWDHIDGPVFRTLLATGYSWHEHQPPVRHLTAEA